MLKQATEFVFYLLHLITQLYFVYDYNTCPGASISLLFQFQWVSLIMFCVEMVRL